MAEEQQTKEQPQVSKKYKVNPELDTETVTVATGEQDEDGNHEYVSFPAGTEFELEEKYADESDYDGTPYFVEAN